MGKSEILMLLAGVALSIMLAMIAVPMFSSGNDMADRQQVQQDLMSIKSSIPLILALEGNEDGKFSSENIVKHVKGFIEDAVAAAPHDGIIVNTKNKDIVGKETTYQITDDATTGKVTILATPPSGFNLEKLTRLDSICDGFVAPATTGATFSAGALTCVMKR